MRPYDAERRRLSVFAGYSDPSRRAGHGGFEEPAEEFRLTLGSSFLKNAVGVGARGPPADFELRGGGGKAVSGYDFGKNAGLGGGQPERCGKMPDLGAKIGRWIDDEDGGGRPVEVEDCHGPVRGERDDMRKMRRAIFAASQLKGATDIGFASFEL